MQAGEPQWIILVNALVPVQPGLELDEWQCCPNNEDSTRYVVAHVSCHGQRNIFSSPAPGLDTLLREGLDPYCASAMQMHAL